MRLHRFYIAEPVGSQKEITIHSDELVNQLSHVFRLKTGDRVILFDGSGNDYECSIASFGENPFSGTDNVSVDSKDDKNLVTFFVEKSVASRYMPVQDIYLYASVVKKDTFEWIVEKATELGVTKIIPVIADRSEKKNLNVERLKKIAIEASEQSGRGTVPEINPIISLKEALAGVSEESRRGSTSAASVIVFHTDAEPFRRDGTSALTSALNKLAIFIGPEGGWSTEELELFHSNKIPVVSLGTQVLRAETAVVAALSLTMLGK